MSVGSGAAASALQRPSEGLSAAKVLGLAMRVRVTAWSDDRSRAEMTLNVTHGRTPPQQGDKEPPA